MNQTDVLIVGAGPTGMVAALCLAASGVSCLLVDRETSLKPHPKAHELSARSIEILMGLGFTWEELSAEAAPHEDSTKVLFCDTIDQEFGCIDLAGDGGDDKYRRNLAAPVPYLNISQVELERVIRRKVEAEPRITLRTGQQWESFGEGEERIRSTITDRASGEPWSVESRFVICADGAGSRTRRALGVAMDGPEKIRDFVNAYFEADLSDCVSSRGKLYFIFNPDAAGAFIAHHIEKRWVYNCVVHTPHERVEDYTPEVMKRRIHAALGRDDVKIEVTSMSSWRMTAQVAQSFRVGRAFLVGDAAHRFPPTGGLGMNSGIGDAHNLAWKIASVLQDRAPEALLDTYEQERRPVVRVNCEESRLNAENLMDVLGAFGIDVETVDVLTERLHTGPALVLPKAGRDWLRRQANRYGASVMSRYHTDPKVRDKVLSVIASQRSHFDRIGLDLGYLYQEGALLDDGTPLVRPDDEVSQYLPSTRPGSRFPHFWLDGRRRARSSHTLIDYAGATLILGEALAAPSGLDGLCSRARLQIRSLVEGHAPLSYRAALHAFCQIERDGALLLRPDGHVAWRQVRGVVLSEGLLASMLEETLLGRAGSRPPVTDPLHR
jgi:2,4-dichlorophenol 6-monooxygenase